MATRPRMIRSHRDAMALVRTPTRAVWLGILLVFAFAAPLWMSNGLLFLLLAGLAYIVGAIGLNLVSGYAGQLSLGHAFFLAVGAYTAAVISGPSTQTTFGLGINEILVWLPAAGITAGLAGFLVGPIATRLRGLYLAIVTLGLVLVGDHVLRTWTGLTGGVGFGRQAPDPTLLGLDLSTTGPILGVDVARSALLYWFSLVVVILLTILALNLVRSRTGRAFQAVRDRDVAAEIMGIDLTRTKLIAFTVSSAYAGIAGAMLTMRLETIEATQFNLLLSFLFIAMILIGGIASIPGSIAGALVIAILPDIAGPLGSVLTPVFETLTFWRADAGFPLDEFQLEQLLYGALLIAFVLLEPRGLIGLWVRVRNYWKAFPFSY
ncbi:branched-chain amino acid ABC transporter permease [Salsipaludibacter albus]|uniref:branched-chain amino acid ABC transporter permease n=1 Tax=Salsipaludibacter albus TaxID=2849650 RepID=UPI001EE44067|nr:branched-chain amino acid ABC transporter permease [Salsipaludibacter albus]MBY5161975.1 branched-chain amino acid ABC transporter permease [Salsipaludibacter albus]